MAVKLDLATAKKLGIVPAKGKGRSPARVPGRPNGTEAKWGDLLWADKVAGAVVEYAYEPATLVLASGLTYTPDYGLLLPGAGPLVCTAVGRRVRLRLDFAEEWLRLGCPLAFDEVKGGYKREDAVIKLREAAAQFPMFRFRLCELIRGEWRVSVVPNGVRETDR